MNHFTPASSPRGVADHPLHTLAERLPTKQGEGKNLIVFIILSFDALHALNARVPPSAVGRDGARSYTGSDAQRSVK